MLGECRLRQVDHSPLRQNQERFLTLERTTAESSNELTVTDTHKGIHDAGFSSEAALLPFTSVSEERDADGKLVWGRVVEDIPAFCRELVAALSN